MQDEADNRLDVVLSDRLKLLSHIVHRQRHGLLDDDVLAGLGRRDDVRVCVSWGVQTTTISTSFLRSIFSASVSIAQWRLYVSR